MKLLAIFSQIRMQLPVFGSRQLRQPARTCGVRWSCAVREMLHRGRPSSSPHARRVWRSSGIIPIFPEFILHCGKLACQNLIYLECSFICGSFTLMDMRFYSPTWWKAVIDSGLSPVAEPAALDCTRFLCCSEHFSLQTCQIYTVRSDSSMLPACNTEYVKTL